MPRLLSQFLRPAALISALGLMCGLAASYALAAGAETGKLDKELERRAFVAENLVFTFYHELGHALIDLLEVPVLGKEEDAVDALAVLLSSQGHAPEAADAMIASAAESFAISDEWAAQGGEEFAFWDEHSLDAQRFYSIICLYYGGEPDELETMADDMELPDERRDLCIDERAQAERAWSNVFDSMDKEMDSAFTQGVTLIRKTPSSDENKQAAKLLAGSDLLEQAIAGFNSAFATPAAVTVTLTGCEEANAFYDTETRGITLCYELISEFAEQIDWALENEQ
ncbi:DUF4344 domain-containing metallopeptidase [Pelagibius sp. Alg239-R121]|uniref:DUF4344 domain-containing metallopeptidase n=1 Tax=Pelagibius sp. Alg239-R121 TaxID=2993448 RepID=UPI0024A71AF9|nr:DUF4344 domain-containing metallopeptidase [Pelagibius sp. Alg239-R121]